MKETLEKKPIQLLHTKRIIYLRELAGRPLLVARDFT